MNNDYIICKESGSLSHWRQSSNIAAASCRRWKVSSSICLDASCVQSKTDYQRYPTDLFLLGSIECLASTRWKWCWTVSYAAAARALLGQKKITKHSFDQWHLCLERCVKYTIVALFHAWRESATKLVMMASDAKTVQNLKTALLANFSTGFCYGQEKLSRGPWAPKTCVEKSRPSGLKGSCSMKSLHVKQLMSKWGQEIRAYPWLRGMTCLNWLTRWQYDVPHNHSKWWCQASTNPTQPNQSINQPIYWMSCHSLPCSL